jgi:hypothetical protein
VAMATRHPQFLSIEHVMSEHQTIKGKSWYD